jgi:hypothetical protein
MTILHYRQGQTHAKLQEVLTGEKFYYTFDAISEGGTAKRIAALGETETKIRELY